MDTQENTTQQENIRDEKGRFVPGVSGNPGGRPKDDTKITYWLEKYLQGVNPKSPDGKKRIQELAEKLAGMAYGGNTVAMSMVLDRIDGKVPQSTDITSGGKPIENPLIISTIKPRDVISETQTEESS